MDSEALGERLSPITKKRLRIDRPNGGIVRPERKVSEEEKSATCVTQDNLRTLFSNE